MYQYQITYNTFLFNLAHKYGMAAVLKVCAPLSRPSLPSLCHAHKLEKVSREFEIYSGGEYFPAEMLSSEFAFRTSMERIRMAWIYPGARMKWFADETLTSRLLGPNTEQSRSDQ